MNLNILEIRNCTFSNSLATTSYGGSIYLLNSITVIIENSSFNIAKGLLGGSLAIDTVKSL